MIRKIAGGLCVISMVALIVCALLFCVDYACFDRGFYEQEYTKLDTARSIGFTNTTLMEVTDRLLGYVQGEEESLKFKAEINGKSVTVFGSREREHMVDVKALYQNMCRYRNIAAIAAAAVLALAILLVRRDRLRFASKCYLTAFGIFAVFLVAVGGWAMLDFEGFWDGVHPLFFNNDLWLLNPETDVLIQMVPYQFFYDLVMRIIRLFLACALIPLALSAGYLIYRTVRRKTLLNLAEETEGPAAGPSPKADGMAEAVVLPGGGAAGNVGRDEQPPQEPPRARSPLEEFYEAQDEEER